MHISALQHGKLFFDTYLRPDALATIVDIGAQNINGSLRECMPTGCLHIGVDLSLALAWMWFWMIRTDCHLPMPAWM